MTTTYQTANQEVDMGFTPERFPLGLHMCYVFNNDDERHEVMSRFINRGLDVGEFVGYFADVDTRDLVEEYLADMGIRVPDTAQGSNTLFQWARDVYCPDNHFSPEHMLRQLRTLHAKCHADCRHALRVTGEMSWALSPDVTGAERLIEYEARTNILFETHPLTAICQYDATKFDGATIFKVLNVHPVMVVRGQIVRNPYYVPAREYLASQGLPTEA